LYVIHGFVTCKKTPTEPAVPVILSFEVFNHTQGSQRSFTDSVMSEDSVTININELGVSGVDDRRIALYHDDFSKKIAFSTTGQISFEAPRQDTSYDVVLFNALPVNIFGDQISYQWMDDQGVGLYDNKRDFIVFRRDYDGVTGPEEPWKTVFDELNSALELNGRKWGSITSSNEEGDFSYGYAICVDSQGSRQDGLHEGYRIVIDHERLNLDKQRCAVGLEVAFENITMTEDIGGSPSLMTIQHGGQLRQEGKDLFAYVFIK